MSIVSPYYCLNYRKTFSEEQKMQTVLGILTDDQLNFYHENGYLFVKDFIDENSIDQIKNEIFGIHENMIENTQEDVHVLWENLPEGEDKKIRQLMGSQNISKTIRKIAFSEKLMSAISQLLDDEVELFHSKLMLKAAKKGSFIPWHSDWGYWKNTFKKPSLMNCFLAIDPSTLENGCIRYVPESHKKFIPQQKFESNAGFSIGLPGDINAFNGVPIEMNPGDVCFHGAITIHASEENNSLQNRAMNTFAYSTTNNLIHDSGVMKFGK